MQNSIRGKPVDNFFADTIGIAQSLSTFATLYDANGKPVRSSGYLDGKMPELPVGVFDFAKIHGEHKVTWQPRNGVRIGDGNNKFKCFSGGLCSIGKIFAGS